MVGGGDSYCILRHFAELIHTNKYVKYFPNRNPIYYLLQARFVNALIFNILF